MTTRLSLLLACLLLTACAGGPPPDPVVVQLPELTQDERQRLYDGRYKSPPLVDVNRELEDVAAEWDSEDLTWIETPQGWHARLRIISPEADGLRIGLCVDPAEIPLRLTVDEDRSISVDFERIGVACDAGAMYFLPLVKGSAATLRFLSPPALNPGDFELHIRRVQHRKL